MCLGVPVASDTRDNRYGRMLANDPCDECRKKLLRYVNASITVGVMPR